MVTKEGGATEVGERMGEGLVAAREEERAEEGSATEVGARMGGGWSMRKRERIKEKEKRFLTLLPVK